MPCCGLELYNLAPYLPLGSRDYFPMLLCALQTPDPGNYKVVATITMQEWKIAAAVVLTNIPPKTTLQRILPINICEHKKVYRPFCKIMTPTIK